MNGSVTGRHYRTGQTIRLEWRNGTITEMVSAPEAQTEAWIAPALMDPQVNGYAGVDFQQDDLPAPELERAMQALAAAGCAQTLVTLITDEWPKLMGRLSQLRALRARSPWLQRAIAGWHVEGPFLSPQPGYCGAHDPEVMMDPTADHIRELRSVVGSDPVLLTLAPEREGALEAIRLASASGIKVSLGHTDAEASVLKRAVQAGATGFTHLANGCPQQLDRHSNILWRVFECPGLSVSIIPDGIHVSPALFRIMHRVLPTESILYTTDAMSAAGAPPGGYRIGRLHLEVGADGIVRQPGRSNFAGSALRPIQGVLRAAAMLGCSWREIWDGFSMRPARFMGLASGLERGKPATFCIFQVDEANRVQQLQTCLAGEFAGGTMEVGTA